VGIWTQTRTSILSNIDWWIERADKGMRFRFEDAEAKRAFAAICGNFAVPGPTE
jgi:hypothetical protein